MSHSEKHTFALFVQGLSDQRGLVQPHKSFSLTDKDIWLRIAKTLRLKAGETITFFDSNISCTLVLDKQTFSSKNTIQGLITSIATNKPLEPHITLYAGLTKKTTFEQIVYSAAQMGVAQIVPVITEKVGRNWWNEKEVERLKKIMIAACEQSKQFVAPEIEAPRILKDISDSNDTKILFDSHGNRLTASQQNSKNQKISLLFGPEGGLTPDEKKILSSKNFACYKLTPSILRSQDAVMVGLGIIRSTF